MRILLTLATILTLHLATAAQYTGVIVLKRHNTVVQRYYPGRSITFINNEGQRITGAVTGGAADSLYIRFYDIRQGMNQWGLSAWDTLRDISLGYSFSAIKTIIRDRTGLNYAADGGVLVAAGVGLQILEVVNGAYFHQPARDWVSSGSLWTSLGLAGLGAWLITLQVKHYHLGRKFHLEYYGFTLPTPKG